MIEGSKTEVFDKVETLVEAFDKASGAGEMFIVYLTGAINQEGGKSWCPDCDEARPFINKHLEKHTKRLILKGEVQTRDEWVGVSTHPFKVHPLIKAGGVPSMILFDGKNPLHRVEDLDGFKNDELMNMFWDGE